MDEKETTTEDKPKNTVDDTDKGSKSEATTLVDEANAAAERLERANARKEEVLNREEQLMARAALSGRAEAGQAPITKKETEEEYAERFKRGEANPLEDDGAIN